MDCSLPGSSVHRISQARILDGLPFPSLGDIPEPGIELGLSALEAQSLTTGWPGDSLLFFDYKNV